MRSGNWRWSRPVEPVGPTLMCIGRKPANITEREQKTKVRRSKVVCVCVNRKLICERFVVRRQFLLHIGVLYPCVHASASCEKEQHSEWKRSTVYFKDERCDDSHPIDGPERGLDIRRHPPVKCSEQNPDPRSLTLWQMLGSDDRRNEFVSSAWTPAEFWQRR